MTLREVLCQALNTGARGEGGCSTPSITRGNEIRPTPGVMHATDNLTRGNETGNQHRQRENIASHENRRREPRRRPTTSYEARKSASTAGASHDTTCPPKHPTQRHTRQQASRLPLKPDRAHRKLRGQGLSDLPPQSEPAERRRKANTKPARS